MADAIKQIATTDRASMLDFFKETDKNVKVLDGVTEKLQKDPKLAQQLSDPNLSPEDKQAMLNNLAKTVMVDLGYFANETKIISTDEVGQSGTQVKGHYNTKTDTNYINDKFNNSTQEMVSTLGHEMTHAMDTQDGIDISQNRADNDVYANNFGANLASYTNFAMDYNYNSSMATSNNHVGMTSITSTPSIFNSISSNSLVSANNKEFSGLDKQLGDDLTAKDGAFISKHVYKDDNKFKLPEHIQEITDEATLNKYGLSQKDLVNEKTGFKSGVYVNKITGEVTYAYAGTDGVDSKDINTNILQGVGLVSDAYRQGINNALDFQYATQKLGVRASLTGHSLGGGEAAAASEKTGLEAKTYNAAGVNPVTVMFGKGTDNIDNYYMKNDPLTIFQNTQFLAPNALGRQHQLNLQEGSSTLQNFIYGHKITTIINSPDLKDEE